MKIVYIANIRIPTEKAHGYQICKMCEEFSNVGLGVKLLVPTRINSVKGNVFSFYGLKKNFRINYIKSFDFLKFVKYLGKFSFYLQGLWFFIKLISEKVNKDAIVYTRNPEISWLFNLKGHKTIYEAHKWPGSKISLYKYLLKKVDKVICNSGGTEREFKEAGFNNTIVAPNGVDLKKFKIKKSIGGLKKELSLPNDKRIIMYIGHLYRWKGAGIIIKAAGMLLNSKNIIFILIGGTDKDVKKNKQVIKDKKLTNIVLFGHQKKEKIPKFLKCSDILLLPNIPSTQESVEYTSPIKLFEYMASGRPIIASDLPSIREILNKNNAILIEPGSANALVEGIKFVLRNPDFCANISKQAHKDVQEFTWEKRTKRILSFIKK